ncbi:SigE family RNA polymerase sigma factor [Actinophytocola oryzae]|uniref:SigE family RNA polymerase sigma factor n=1 Tax=Actinophytocola oryzae TaxID=502181 RepID=UPI00312C91D3
MNRDAGRGSSWDDEFARYVGVRARTLRATAYSMCGDWHHAEDITQIALLTLYRVWPRIDDETRDAYVRKVLLRVYLDDRRRSWRSREQLTDVVPENSVEPQGFEDRTLVLRALSGMAPRQQEVLVLRYLHDLSVEETAEELGLSTGTVKSQSARGLATLRKRLGPHFPVLVAAAATVAAIIAIVLGIALATTPPGPVEPAVPPSGTTAPRTSPNTTPPATKSPEGPVKTP